MTYLVALHDGSGSMGEGMTAQWEAVVATKDEAVELEEKIYDLVENTYLEDEGLVVITEITNPVSVADALTDLRNGDRYDWIWEEED